MTCGYSTRVRVKAIIPIGGMEGGKKESTKEKFITFGAVLNSFFITGRRGQCLARFQLKEMERYTHTSNVITINT